MLEIRHVETVLASKPFRIAQTNGIHVHRSRDIIVIRVHASDGLCGEAFLTGLGFAAGSEALVIKTIVDRSLAPLVTGENPSHIERLWERMYRETERFGRKGAVLRAISGMDLALWDLLGKRHGLPLSVLLGGYREEVPVYASGGYYYDQEDASSLEREMKSYMERGFGAVKMKVGRASLERDLKRIALVRGVIGPDTKLMLDVNGAWDLNTALRAMKKLEPFDVYWVEEPLPPDQLDEMGILAKHTDVPIAAGENEYTRFGFRDLIVRGGVRIIQADVTRVGGITEWKRVAGLASTFAVPIAPHGVQELHAPLVAAIQGGAFVEYFSPDHPLQQFLAEVFGYDSPIPGPEGLYLPVSNRPGLGLRVDQSVLQEYRVA